MKFGNVLRKIRVGEWCYQPTSAHNRGRFFGVSTVILSKHQDLAGPIH